MSLLKLGTTAYQSVQNTVLRVHGSSGWTGPTSESGTDRTIELTNCGLEVAYVNRIAVGASLSGAVSADRFLVRLDPGAGPLNVYVPAGHDLAVVSSTEGTNLVSTSVGEVA